MNISHISSALTAIRQNKLRSFLTLIGVIIGVCVVYIILSISNMATYAIKNQLTGGSGIITITYVDERNALDYSSQLLRILEQETHQIENKFTNNDLKILEKIEGIEAVSGNYIKYENVKINNEDAILPIKRQSIQDSTFYNYTLIAGSDITYEEKNNSISSIVLDSFTIEQYFDENYENHIGKTIQVNDRLFKIKGIFHNPDTFNPNIILMSDTAFDSLYSKSALQSISIKVNPQYEVNEISTLIVGILNEKYNSENYQILDLSQILFQVNSVTALLSTVMSIIALISLFVAGIGITNIMYVCVIERTKEIGIKRAIGATKRTIKIQFLTEAMILTIIGGIIGIIIGILLVAFISIILNIPSSIQISYIIFTLLFSSLLGAFFGYYPAKKASELNIVSALSYE